MVFHSFADLHLQLHTFVILRYPCLGMGFRQLVEPKCNVVRYWFYFVGPSVDQKYITFQGGC